MDRTVSLPDNWFICEGNKTPSFMTRTFGRGISLPVKRDCEYTVMRKFICPKQINDTVTVFFTGSFSSAEVFAGKERLKGQKDEEGNIRYDVTPCLSKGSTWICARVKKGSIDGFYFSVKRKYN